MEANCARPESPPLDAGGEVSLGLRRLARIYHALGLCCSKHLLSARKIGEERARALLSIPLRKRFRLLGFLGSGASGAVFLAAPEPRARAVDRPSESLLALKYVPCSSWHADFGPRHELLMTHDACKAGLAWPVHGALVRGGEAPPLKAHTLSQLLGSRTAVILQTRVDGTLDELVRGRTAHPTAHLCEGVRVLARRMLLGDLAHNDLHLSNVGYRLAPSGAVDLRFIDCQRVVSTKYLVEHGLSEQHARETVEAGKRADLLGLQLDLGEACLHAEHAWQGRQARALFDALKSERGDAFQGAVSAAALRRLESRRARYAREMASSLRLRLPRYRRPPPGAGETEEAAEQESPQPAMSLPPVRCYSCGRNYRRDPNPSGYCCSRMLLTHPPRAPETELRSGGGRRQEAEGKEREAESAKQGRQEEEEAERALSPAKQDEAVSGLMETAEKIPLD